MTALARFTSSMPTSPRQPSRFARALAAVTRQRIVIDAPTSQMASVNVHAFGHRFRFVYDIYGSGHVWYPHVNVYLHGPNGSPAGSGPKAWPKWLDRIFHDGYAGNRYYKEHRSWRNHLTLPVPHVKWRYHANPVRRAIFRFAYKLDCKVLRLPVT